MSLTKKSLAGATLALALTLSPLAVSSATAATPASTSSAPADALIWPGPWPGEKPFCFTYKERKICISVPPRFPTF